MQNSRYEKRKRAIITSWAIFFLVGLIIGILVGTVVVKALSDEKPVETSPQSQQQIPESKIPEPELHEEQSTIPPVTLPVTEKEEPKLVSLGVFRLTAYCSCEKCCGYWATIRPKDENGNPIVYTASGKVAEAGKTIAADTSVLPFGTIVQIDGHEYIVQDRGGAITENRIDIYFDDHQEALNFGVQYQEVFIIEEE